LIEHPEKNMTDHEEKSTKESLRVEKLKAEEARLLAKDQARTKDCLAKELEIEKTQKAKSAGRAEERARGEIQEVAKEKARKEAYIAREKKIADELEARKLKNQKPS
jgi:hypothetical protein